VTNQSDNNGEGNAAQVDGGRDENAFQGEAVSDLSSSSEGIAREEVVSELAQELAETKDRYLRLMADFENFKKRALKEQSELLKYQGERLVVDILDVLDNLELALAHSSAEYEKLKQGLEMVHRMFIERLGKWEIRGDSGIGQQFDPHKHSAISRVPGNSAQPGTIVGELKKPYFYRDKLIRVGEVVVAAAMTDGED
jgi:molecular chaperone GrpE